MQISDLVQIYQCLCDETRLRILNLLTQGPLCVCHLQEVLGEPQVKISKHLSYLKGKEVVDATRHQNWMIYSLPSKCPTELEASLKCLQDCVQTHGVFKEDLRRLSRLRPKFGWLDELECCGDNARNKASHSSE
jgi:ArsR family transcriptional regulator